MKKNLLLIVFLFFLMNVSTGSLFATNCSTSNPSVCNDGDACTVDDCAAGLCVHRPKFCDDNNACTVDSCSNGQCITTPKICDDGNPNTSDSCDMAMGCVFTCIEGTSCDDGNICTIEDKCAYITNINVFQCLGGKSKCNDGDSNTFDTCNINTGECTFAPVVCPGTTSCDDGNLCTTNDQCSSNQCKGVKKACDDGNSSTVDTCTPTTGECTFTLIRQGSNKSCMGTNAADCNDSNPCTLDICQAGLCFYDAKHNSPCDDGNSCTTADACFINQCTGTQKVCDDQKTNTTDSCNATTGECVFTPIVCQEGSSCDDGNLCTINDLCSNSLCAGTSKICDDGNPNTKDECTQSTGECLNTPVGNSNDNNSTCLNNCSRPNGRCNKRTNTCICKPTFTGEDCSQRECPRNCSGNGTCENKTGRCLCNPGFTGKICSIQKVSCANALGCGKKQLCERGRCLLISGDRLDCINSNECSNNELCDAGYCVKNLSFAIKCLNSSKCRSTEICDKGFCVVPSDAIREVKCSTPDDCFSDNEICDNGFCVAPP